MIVRGAGNVGKGFFKACASRPAGTGACWWNADVISVGPAYDDTSRTATSTGSATAAATDGILSQQQIKSRIEDINEHEFQ